MKPGPPSLPAKIVLVLAIAAIVALLLPETTGTVYESDQAALLAGSLTLSHGGPWFHRDFYNYDRQFLTYWTHAVLWRAARLSGSTLDQATLSNRCALVFFWGALALLILATPSSRANFLLAAGALLTPSFLLHSPFTTSAFLSAGLLVLLAASMRATQKVGFRCALMGLFAFGAVGARADAVLALPMLLWLDTDQRRLRTLTRAPATWTVLGGSAVAVFLGRIAANGGSQYFDTAFFRPELFAAYTVFGLGPCLVLLGFALAALIGRIGNAGRGRWFELAGLAFLLAPVVYYGVQLYSTRYWVLSALVSLFVMLSRRGALAVKRAGQPVTIGLACLTLAVAVIPCAVGIRLPARNRATLTLTQPTAFPTMDGHIPMGAYVAYGLDRWNCDEGRCDHNQPLWLAARDATLERDATGRVPLLHTPMYWFLAYAALRQGKEPEPVELSAAPARPFVYTDSRSLTRPWMQIRGTALNADPQTGLLERTVTRVSPDYAGLSILRIAAGPPSALGRLLQTGRRLFDGDDFRVIEHMQADDAVRLLRRAIATGRRTAVLASVAFAVEFIHTDGRIVRYDSLPAGNGCQRVILHANTDPAATCRLVASGPDIFYTVYFGALPEYMSVRRFAAKQ